MGTVIVNANLTLDGVVQVPSDDDRGDRDATYDRGDWFAQMSDADRAVWAEIETAEALATDALLLGRRSDAWFASRWLSRTGVWADRLNGLPKYVVSQTLQTPHWSNGTVLHGDVVEEVTALKARVEGQIVVIGSGTLVQTLVEHDLVDELRLMVHPFVLGSGRRLFGDLPAIRPLRLLGTQAVGSQIVNLRYAVVH